MKKFFTLCAAVLVAASMFAVTITMGDVTPATLDDGLTFTEQGITFKALKVAGGNNNPVINPNSHDLRIYANGTLEISGVTMTEMVFTLSAKGKQRLTDIAVNTGAMAYDTAAMTVTWTGNASDVIFTVGEKATRGSDGVTKAG